MVEFSLFSGQMGPKTESRRVCKEFYFFFRQKSSWITLSLTEHTSYFILILHRAELDLQLHHNYADAEMLG